MASKHDILLISDRADCSQKLARLLGRLTACRTIGLSEAPNAPNSVLAAVMDIGLLRPANIERLRCQLSRLSMSGVPIMALLRDNSHLERVQAAAVGATVLLPPKASAADYAAALAAVIQPATCSPASASAIPQDIEAARLQFGTIFDTARRGEIVRKSSIDEATESVMAAISARGIRQWLEVVWTYHNATYQHCLLVTGLAAEFAAILRFTMNDQKRIIGAALLHDLGKAKIPLAILNKPGSLTNKEVEIMRDHARIGYELLSRQGDFEQEQLEVILKHHELLDGSGYPDGLAGSQINDLVRLVTISDIYAALIERRSYKENIHPAEAFKTFQNMEGKLEGALVRAFGKVAERAATAGIRPLS